MTGAVVVHCQPCDDDPQERWRAAVAQLIWPAAPAHPKGRYDPQPACTLCLFDAVNAAVRDRHPITVLPLETAP